MVAATSSGSAMRPIGVRCSINCFVRASASLHRDLTDLAAQLVNGGRGRDLIQLLVAAAELCWVLLS